QLDIYKKADGTNNGIYVILYFHDSELLKLNNIIKDIGMSEFIDKKIFIIDCRKKLSASKAK
ncbi:MAG: hypothetical protein PHS92_05400, partial [Candidatus Gracilibacteria bacterium]|nr:hypothetical protein [Candidatus Gracilibacteria bacterium]